jgi:hypothetical protein
MLESIVEVLMRRDGVAEYEANAMVCEARAALREVIDNGGGILEAEEVVKDYFGLEPDYLMELLD